MNTWNTNTMNTEYLVQYTFHNLFKHTFHEQYLVPNGYNDPINRLEISCMFRLTNYRGDYDIFMVCNGYQDGQYVGREVFD